jgi:16S rRNA (guanine527-N7)-methyltransferase
VKREVLEPVAGRLAALAREHSLGAVEQEKLSRFLELLAEDPHAPSAVRAPAEAVDVHLADSLVALPCLDAALAGARSARVADLGSGAGLPGIPLAAVRPGSTFELVEATRRKCRFIEQAVERLGLSNVVVRCLRAEELPRETARESYRAVLARALAPLPTLVEYAGPLLQQGGQLLAWKGRPDRPEEEAGTSAALQVGLEPLERRAVKPYARSRSRHLYLYRKVRPCPPGFPRRPGMAHRHPLA